ncbi:malonate decarboxylase holo-[acyl-carrier-protein] synthase [Roseateles asaccharophilus]|uniref:Phosphoribosyl-dephospho-CoA transferase n=1 Tax=Roseateles asaccharophilus TaxID=582607 RepID=A0ABU2A6Q8_9BURK|nr:malonate decarboxylase holo-[acyl-carrier-protein] synthase [Roseateles asaccharophilus]MDR7332882.1 phosphoribosyl-dephospho-CoA transferase [Roseateles asaccharophilus]
MTPLHRHQIAWLSHAGWQRLLDGDWDDEARACLLHWAAQGLPVVVTRQPPGDDGIALGLSAPTRWNRRRLALRVTRAEVLYFDEFPRLEKITAQLPAAARMPARQLAVALQGCCATARVYGSHGWQHLSGLDHLRDGSDLDLWVAVNDAEQADAVAAALAAFSSTGCRLDGELIFPGDRGIAWREWQAWRAGRAQALLVKRLHGASLETPEPSEALA